MISEPPAEGEGFNEISKVEVQLICDTPFKVILWPCLCKIPVGIKKMIKVTSHSSVDACSEKNNCG